MDVRVLSSVHRRVVERSQVRRVHLDGDGTLEHLGGATLSARSPLLSDRGRDLLLGGEILQLLCHVYLASATNNNNIHSICPVHLLHVYGGPEILGHLHFPDKLGKNGRKYYFSLSSCIVGSLRRGECRVPA